MRLFFSSVDDMQKVSLLEILKSFFDYHLPKLYSYILNNLYLFAAPFGEFYESFIRNKHLKSIKKYLFVFFFIFVFPFSIFIKDYFTDKIKIANTYIVIEKALNQCSLEYERLFNQIREKTLTEGLYRNSTKMSRTLAELVFFESQSYHSSPKKIKGARWITADLDAIGPYGKVQNFNSSKFIVFVRSIMHPINWTSS